MSEKWDAYDKSFNKISNLVLERGKKLPQEVFHLVGEIIVKHKDETIAYKWVTRDELLNMKDKMASSRTMKLLEEQRF